MKIFAATLLTLLFVTNPVFADKPSWAGKGHPPTEEEKARHKEEMRNKHKKSGGGDVIIKGPDVEAPDIKAPDIKSPGEVLDDVKDFIEDTKPL